ncbi:MAG: EF-Tu/IF-2/RF-3 family GTPase [Candidatus Altiarchaeota archaeon]
MTETKVGEVFSFFPKPGVAALRMTNGTLKVGDRIHVLGHTTDFTQTVNSIQVEHNQVGEANAGDQVGIKVESRVRPNDTVYRIE